ncbi:MAG: L-threonylcarbamoyladenylate synthase [bacterium]
MLYKINPNKIDRKILKEVVEWLKNGKVIIYPTDTSYALGCDATNEKAVVKIFKIKRRKKNKSLPVIVADLKMAEKFFILGKKEKELGKKFWRNFDENASEKGKLSIVLMVKKNTVISKFAIAQDNTVATRVPNSLWARGLSLALKNPIISTSVNLSGMEACYGINEIKKSGIEYKNIDLILDAGKLPYVAPSTIVRVKGGRVEVLRNGSAKMRIAAL